MRQNVGLTALIAGALVIGTPLAAGASGSGGVTITLTCGTLPSGTGTFTVTANGADSDVSVPCGGSATATNAAWRAGSNAYIGVVTYPVGTRIGPSNAFKTVTLTTGVVQVTIVAVPIPSGGLTIALACGGGVSGSATFKVTANDSSSTVSVPCRGSATVTNPLWTAQATAKVELIAGPKGAYLVARGTYPLQTSAVTASMEFDPCPTSPSRYSPPTGCPVVPEPIWVYAYPVVMLALLSISVFWVIVARRKTLARLRANQPDSPLQILEKRFASGEISADQYRYERYELEKGQ